MFFCGLDVVCRKKIVVKNIVINKFFDNKVFVMVDISIDDFL